jgi:DNA-binding response OmpR family regulator
MAQRAFPLTSQTPAILLLDDDVELLRLMTRVLESAGYRVEAAQDAERALAICERERPCMLFVDLMLPRMDGEAFLNELKRRWSGVLPPVVVVSASAVRDEVARRVAATASLEKPFSLEEIREIVDHYCGDFRARRSSHPGR